MRFILRYKFGIFQRKSQRIFVESCRSTTDIVQFIEKKTNKKSDDFILRISNGDRLGFRILKGWALDNYELREGDELQLELLEKEETESPSRYNNKYIVNLLGSRKQLNQIVEQDSGQEEDSKKSKVFNIRQYIDKELEKLLKLVQKGKIEAILRLLNDCPPDVTQDVVEQIQKIKGKLLNQLGQGGWASIHYAVFCNRQEVLEQLINQNVDINKCTADGWLPIQLAVNRKNINIVRRLLKVDNINVNELTSKGTALHIAAKGSYLQGIAALIEAGADWRITDDRGRNCLELCQCQESINFIKKKEQEKQKDEQQKSILLSRAIIKGEVFQVKHVFMQLKTRYLIIDPYQGSLIIYENELSYPKHPKETIPLETVKEESIRLLLGSNRTWQMKKDYIYFEFHCQKKFMFASRHHEIAVKWVCGLQDAVKYQKISVKNNISQIAADQVVIQCNDITNYISSNKEVTSSVKASVRKQIKGSDILRRSNASEFSTETFSPKFSPKLMSKLSSDSMSSRRSDKTPDQQLQFSGKKSSSEESSLKETNVSQQSSDINSQLSTIVTEKTNFSSFEIIKTLGSGSFGKVFLAKHIISGKMYALKALKKKTLIMQKQIKYAVTEARVLKQASHPFIINMHYAFQTQNYLYLALDYCSGKDLSFHLARQETFKEDDVRFYMAQLILALEHLHSKNILYRDMKPENILLDGEGHVKLADFGLSKDNVTDKTKSFCGSPAYLAPEVLGQKGGCKESDWYGVGMVMYECLVGQSPFFNDDIQVLYQNISQGKLKFPKFLSENAKQILKGLLQREPKKRLGSKGTKQIKEHPFFKSIDWKAIESLKIKPPVREHTDDADDSDDEIAMFTNQNGKFVDFDYADTGVKPNRLNDFSFVRSH